VYALDRDKRVVYWNHGAEQITGYLRQEVLGREYRGDLVVESDEHSPLVCVHGCPLEPPPDAGTPQRVMTYVRHRSGHVVPVWLWTLSLKDGSGSIAGSVKILSEQRTAPEPLHAGSLHASENKDAETGLPDRATMEAFVRAQSEVAILTKVSCGMIRVQVGVDRFRHAHGRAAAAVLMREVGCTLQEMVRGTDLVGRWAEDCFMAALPDCSPEVLERVAARMRRVGGQVAIPWTGDRLSTAVEVRTTLIMPGEALEAMLARLFPPPAGNDAGPASSPSAGA
jgi:PAS domain S-box-containing protein